MKSATLKALKGSIAKWEGILAEEIYDDGSDNCPLCNLFLDSNCAGCPVRNKTGDYGCEGSPYVEWRKSDGNGDTASTPKLKKIALAEINFLNSLLPK